MSARYFLDERNLLSLGLSPQNIITMRALANLLNVQNTVADIQGATGLIASDGAGTITGRTLTAPAAGITVTNGSGVAGNPTLVLANDLSALEGMSGTGLVARTASETYAQRTVTAGTGVSVTNGDGVSGNPTIALASDAASASLLTTLGGDPNADRIVFWDDSAGAFKFLTAGTNLSISGTTITGSAAWTLVGSGQTATGIWNQAVDGSKTNVDFTGIAADELLLILDAVTGSAGTANRTIRVSTDNGSTFYNTSGDYVELSSAGTVTNRNAATFLTGATASAASMEVQFRNIKGAVKFYTNSGAVPNGLFKASASDINAIRVTSNSADTLNGGKIYLFGR